MKKKGFTVAEILVTLSIVGVLASVIIYAVDRIRPNQDLIMLRKAYYLTSRTVAELINDPNYYPDTNNPTTSGFSNINHPATYHGRTYSGDGKFCNLMASRMNTVGDVNCDESFTFTDGQTPDGNFSTTDGMVWIVPIGNFSDGSDNVIVDVNGADPPNTTCDGGNNCRPDRFSIRISRDGKIDVDEIAREMLTTNDLTMGTPVTNNEE